MNKSKAYIGDNNPMEFDDEWWEFILADEPISEKQKTKVTADNNFSSNAENNWDYIEEVFRNDEIILVTVQGFNKGGLLAKSEEIQGFIPSSHILPIIKETAGNAKYPSFASRVGEKIKVKIVECNPSTKKVVLSERAAQTENGRRREIISCLKTGSILKGIVTNITDFGVFVDLGGVEGLIHISELSWGRVRFPSDHVKENEEITVQILSVNAQDMHVALSLKRLTPNPWFEIERKYKPGDIVSARISKILPYGVFACLEEGVEGLIHISTLKMNDNIRDLNELFQDGEQMMAEILQIDSKKHRLGLALVIS